MGRFINADGIIGANRDILGYNLYAYVSNNPIMFSDPSGNHSVVNRSNNTLEMRTKTNNTPIYPISNNWIEIVPECKKNVFVLEIQLVDKIGFNTTMDPIFLNRTNALKLANHIIIENGTNGKLYGMNNIRIASELYAHAVIYYASEGPNKLLSKFGMKNNVFNEIKIEAGDLNVNNNDKKAWAYYVIWYGS